MHGLRLVTVAEGILRNLVSFVASMHSSPRCLLQFHKIKGSHLLLAPEVEIIREMIE